MWANQNRKKKFPRYGFDFFFHKAFFLDLNLFIALKNKINIDLMSIF